MISHIIGGFALIAIVAMSIGCVRGTVDLQHGERIIAVLLLVAVVGFK